jgi:hypothetical protein
MQTQDIPVLLIIFNRPQKVRALITALGAVQPKKIYIVADGPRPHVETDIQSTKAAREAALDIPWECEVHTKFLDKNLRSRHNAVEYSAVYGLDWFFSENEMGIVLEDDCIPNPSFFTFTAELLEKYKDDTRVMHISGNNFQDGHVRGDASYYFSLYTHSWGWATWARAWNTFHPAVADMEAFVAENRIASLPLSKAAQKFWLKSYSSQRHWDSLWQYTIWHAGGMSILPNKNLVTNIGFGKDATNTKDAGPLSNMMTEAITKIVHPSSKTIHRAADDYTFMHLYYRSFLKRVTGKIIAILKICLKSKT